MIALKIILTGTDAFKDVADEIDAAGELTRVALLRGGMESGASSVALLVKLNDGRRVMAQTSLAMLVSAARALAVADANDFLKGEELI